MIKKQHILNIKNMLSGVNRKVYNEEIVDVRNINFIKKKINKYKIFIYNFKLNKKNHKKLLKIEKLNKRKKKNYITNLFFNNNLKCINKSFNGFINDREHSTVYMLQNYEDSSREEDFKMIEYIKKSFSFPRKPSP
jgi:hypothetical protein